MLRLQGSSACAFKKPDRFVSRLRPNRCLSEPFGKSGTLVDITLEFDDEAVAALHAQAAIVLNVKGLVRSLPRHLRQVHAHGSRPR